MSYSYRIWDKQSPVNGCSAELIMQRLSVTLADEAYVIVDENGRDRIIQTQKDAPYPGETIEASAQNHINAILAEDAAAAEAAKQPTLEDRVKALEAAQLAALGV